MHSSSSSESGTHIVHNATLPVSDITGGSFVQIPLKPLGRFYSTFLTFAVALPKICKHTSNV